MTSLDVSVFSELETLDCSNCFNQEESRSYSNGVLDLSANIKLKSLDCGYNDLIGLILPDSPLTSVYCEHNQLTTLDVSKNTNLTSLSCESNRMLTLNVSANTQLEYLNCGYQRTAENYDQQLILTINEAQQTLWDNDWKHNNYNVVVSDEAVSVSGGSGSNFGNGGVY